MRRPVDFKTIAILLLLPLAGGVLNRLGGQEQRGAYRVGQTLGQTANFLQTAQEIHVGPGFAGLVREGDRFARDFSGSAPAGRRLRINAHGPVSVQAGAANSITYTVHLSVRARTEAEARNVIERYNVRVTPQGEWVIITAPGGPVISAVIVKAPRLDHLVVSTSDGAGEASGIEGALDVDTCAGELTADRIGGDCKLVTGGGDVRVG